jgi:lipid-binding SYLF domain-containing protein
MTDRVIKEAARLMKENPNLKFYEALIEAKKILKEKAKEDSK